MARRYEAMDCDNVRTVTWKQFGEGGNGGWRSLCRVQGHHGSASRGHECEFRPIWQWIAGRLRRSERDPLDRSFAL